MGIESVIDADVSLSQIALAQERFGVPLLLAFHTVGAGGPLVRAYSSVQEAISAGHSSTSLVVKVLTKMFSQRRRPPQILVGRRTHTWTQVVSLTPLITTEGFVYRFRINGVLFTYTVLAAATPTSISTALSALIDASTLGNVSAVVGAACVVTTSAAGAVWEYTELQTNPMAFVVEDQTPEASIADDLNAVMAEDSTWYGLTTDVTSKAAVIAVAAVIEATRKIFVAEGNDSAIVDGTVSTDVVSVLQASATMRTFVEYHPDFGAWSGAALLSRRLTTDPGADTWAFVQLSGVRAYTLNTSQENALKAKNAGSYTTLAGRGTTLWGQSCGGMFMDVVRGVDWLFARMRERLFALFVAASAEDRKIPFTDAGITVITGEVNAVLLTAATDPHNLVVESTIMVGAPKESEISDADKAARHLPNLTFSADLQGAVHTMTLRGILRT